MKLIELIVRTTTYFVGLFSSFEVESANSGLQVPLFDYSADPNGGPVFKPPTGRPINLPGGDLECDYSAMGSDWVACSTPENRGCWLNNTKTGEQYNITTDYEDPKKIPKGIDRYYYLSASDGYINTDGVVFKHGKFFWNTSDLSSWEPENRYPGPWVQACWGDTLHINVFNNLTFNGTSVHWHGIQQEETFDADGVPGITQCPIAPKDEFTYQFRATQYGSSWYHSHFSLQYADGAAGPMTLHGPHSDNWDLPKYPIMLTDWGHNSAFQAIWQDPPGTAKQVGLGIQSTLLNGVGNVTRYNTAQKNTSEIPQPYNLTVSSQLQNGRPKRYLLRLINISFESHFVFSIDNHNLTVISTDFVPVHPYNTTSVRIGIGQRYNVILIADRLGSLARSFWMRVYRPQCFVANGEVPPTSGYEKAGVVFYDDETTAPAENVKGWYVDDQSCTDEPFESMHPVVNWTIAHPPIKNEDDLYITFDPLWPNKHTAFPLSLFSIGGQSFNPLQINYSHPMILNLTWDGHWPEQLVVYPENYTSEDWVYLLLQGKDDKYNTYGAHPIHLHGHDFAILAESNTTRYSPSTPLKLDNPPRRDVVMLPKKGFALIAFKTDNPGPWIMHCHIAQHASFGLALQILERQDAAHDIMVRSGALDRAKATCANWNAWWDNCTNWWYDEEAGQKPGDNCKYGEDWFSPDSGI